MRPSIRDFRRDNLLRQQDVADFLGVNISFITNIECGRAKLPQDKLDMLLNNDRGWLTYSLQGNGKDPENNPDDAVIVKLLDLISASEARIDRVSNIVERLTDICNSLEHARREGEKVMREMIKANSDLSRIVSSQRVDYKKEIESMRQEVRETHAEYIRLAQSAALVNSASKSSVSIKK